MQAYVDIAISASSYRSQYYASSSILTTAINIKSSNEIDYSLQPVSPSRNLVAGGCSVVHVPVISSPMKEGYKQR